MPNAAPTPEQRARAQGRAALQAEATEISELCQLAGQPELAAEFIAAGKSVTEVRQHFGLSTRAPPAKTGPTGTGAVEMWAAAFALARRRVV